MQSTAPYASLLIKLNLFYVISYAAKSGLDPLTTGDQAGFAATASISMLHPSLTKPDTSTSVLAGLLAAKSSFLIEDTVFA